MRINKNSLRNTRTSEILPYHCTLTQYTRKKPPSTSRSKPGKDFDVTIGGKYRDRAKERREGINPDYQEDELLLQSIRGNNERYCKTLLELTKYKWFKAKEKRRHRERN